MIKIFQSSIFRAICSITVGALLIKYRTQTVTGITIAIGILFFVSGIISTISYFISKKGKNDIHIFDAQGNSITKPETIFPIVGIGSMILGAFLALAPNTFTNMLMYILATVLILGALTQYFILAGARKIASIGLFWWIIPTIVLIVGLVALIKPSVIASAPLFVIGWAMIVYGIIDLINAIKVTQCQKAWDKAHPAIPKPEEQSSTILPEAINELRPNEEQNPETKSEE